MTIGKGEPWGREVPRPDRLVVVADDRALAAALTGPDSSDPVAVASGDMLRTLGNPPLDGRATLNELPLDVVGVRLDGGAEVIPAVAHVVARSPWTRGGWCRGPILLIMNSEFRGRWDVAPRGHPNDGRVEIVRADASLRVRERAQALRRVRSGTHLPHPRISTRSARSGSWSFDTPMVVFVDGRRVGRAGTIEVEVMADAGRLYA
ncbi:MAG: hypothetical protein WBP59_00600 [Ilumatobacteraceae bacterium]